MGNFPVKLEHHSGLMIVLDPTRLLLAFKETAESQDVNAILKDLDLVIEEDFMTGNVKKDSNTSSARAIVNNTDKHLWVRSKNGKTINKDELGSIEHRLGPHLEWIGPVFRSENKDVEEILGCPIPNVLLIKPMAGMDQRLIERLHEYGAEQDVELSKYSSGYYYFVIGDIKKYNAFEVREILLRETDLVLDIHYENMPFTIPLVMRPRDPLFRQQWNMLDVSAGGDGRTGWDISTGRDSVVIAILDSGVDLGHQDLRDHLVPGINLNDMSPGGGPTTMRDIGTRAHGTATAGVAAAAINNDRGISGMAGNCRIMPLALQTYSDREVITGINYAVTHGARVICLPLGYYRPGEGPGTSSLVSMWDFSMIDAAIMNAVSANCILCAASGNENLSTTIRYPARNPQVIACGASDREGNRHIPSSSDGEDWGANFGPGISVVAPGIHITTTDIRSTAGYNRGSGASVTFAGHPYTPAGDTDGDYIFYFSGTSIATAHVSGLAALLISQYNLSNPQVRTIIERTADKSGTLPYGEQAPNGTRNLDMGYGKINVYKALDLADVMIMDWRGDTGVEPSTPPGDNFWTFSDIVVSPIRGLPFDPDDVAAAGRVERGRDNYLRVKATNKGPNTARNVNVDVRIVPYIGTEFIYPNDWDATDANHIVPTAVNARFASIPANNNGVAEFTITSAQVDTLWGWQQNTPGWHPCILARVSSENDYTFPSSGMAGTPTSERRAVLRRNNLAQRNLSVIPANPNASVSFSFIGGNKEGEEDMIKILIDRSKIPEHMKVSFFVDNDASSFPSADLKDNIFATNEGESPILGVKGNSVDITDKAGTVVLRKQKTNQVFPLRLSTTLPKDAKKGDQFLISILQRDKKENVVGGATVIWIIE